jgi:hypothetical protein
MNLFLIGCGFTKAVYSQAPLNSELFDALQNQKATSAASSLRNEYPSTDIEIALTKLDLRLNTLSPTSKDGKRLFQLRRELETELALYFSRFSASQQLLKEAPWISKFLTQAILPGDTLISLNYDCLLEGLLDLCNLWSPMGGYGSVTNDLIDESHFQRSPVTVLKIHGSTNFILAPYINNPKSETLSFEFNETIFPNTGRGSVLGGGVGGRRRIIAPSYVKLPDVDLTYLMLDALRASANAKRLVVIGCSLRPEDTFLTLLTTHFLRQEAWKERRIVIVDPNAADICSMIQDYWGVSISGCLIPIHNSLENCAQEVIRAVCESPRAEGGSQN